MIDLSTMKQQIETLLNQAIERLKTKGVLKPEVTPVIKITHTTDPQHGDFATNLALTLSKAAGMSHTHWRKK